MKLQNSWLKDVRELIYLLSIMLVILIIGLVALDTEESKIRDEKGDVLNAVLRNTRESYHHWISLRKIDLGHFLENPKVVALTQEILKVNPTKKELANTPIQKEIRAYFKPFLERFDDLGIFIISTDTINHASMRDENLGEKNLIASQRKGILKKVFEGEIELIPPIRSDVSLESEYGQLIKDFPTMFVAGPIKNEAGKVIAVLTFRINLLTDFSRILRNAQFGITGDIYAFDNNGFMISTSRFNDDLRKLNILDSTETSILKLRITDPGVNLMKGQISNISRDEMPLTLMALQAIKGNDGLNVKGYNDYRGVLVMGAWAWIDEFDFGIASEIDVEEGMARYNSIRKSFFVAYSIGIVIIISLTYVLFLARRRRENKILAEKIFSDTLIESLPGVFYVLDEEGFVIRWNSNHEKITGYSKAEYKNLKALDTIYPEDREKVASAIQRVKNEEYVEIEAHIVNKFGEKFSYILTGKSVSIDGSEFLIGVGTDITERKKAEEELNRSMKRYEGFISASNTGAWEFDNDGEYLWCSPEYFTMLGRNTDDYNLTGTRNLDETWINLIHPDERERSSKKFADYLSGGSLGMYENYFRMQHADGRWIWIWSRGSTLRDENGNLTNVTVGTHIDITERKKAEEALKESEEKFRTIFTDAPIGIVVTSRDGSILESNKSLTGYSKTELEQLKAQDIYFNLNDRTEMLHILNKSGIVKNFETKWRHKEGNFIDVNLTIVPTTYKGEEAFLGISQDITDRKRAEEELRVSEERNSTILNNASDGIYFRRKGRYEFVNPRFSEITGYPKEELLSPDFDINVLFNEETREFIQERIKQRKMGGKVIPRYQIPIRNKFGKRVDIEVSIEYLDEENELIGMGFIQDITERKKAAEDLELHKKELEKSNKELTSLTQHIQDLIEMERKALAREIHDDLGQTLTALKLDLVGVKNQLEPDQQEEINNLKSAIELSNQAIKTTQHITSELRPGIIDDLGLIPAIDWYTDQFSKRSKIKINLEVKIVEKDIKEDYKIAIYRIIQESLTNVARHAKATIVTIILDMLDAKISLIIKDNGVGISKQEKEKSNSFGLLGMRERAHAIKGEISIESQKKSGTTITLNIPINS